MHAFETAGAAGTWLHARIQPRWKKKPGKSEKIASELHIDKRREERIITLVHKCKRFAKRGAYGIQNKVPGLDAEILCGPCG